MTSTMMVVNCRLMKVGLKHHVTGLQPSYEDDRNLNAASIQGCHGNKVVLECQCYFRLGFVVILVIDLLVAKSSNLSVYTICFCSKQQKLYYQIVARKCFYIALHTRLMMKILQTFERYHQINNRNEEKLTRKQIQAHTRENTQEFMWFGFQRISMGIRQKIFSLMNVENTKWCNSILTSHNAQIPIYPNCSLIQIQSSLSIQKLGLNTKFGVASS